MNKTELIDSIATQADISKAAAGRALDAAVETIKAAKSPKFRAGKGLKDSCN